MSNIFENKGAMAVTIMVAASNSLDPGAANYVCDGTNDEVEIMAANAALPASGGIIQLTEGTFNIGAQITLTRGCTLQGASTTPYVVKGITKLQLANGVNPSYVLLLSGEANTINVRDIFIDGNKNNNTSGTGLGISISGGNFENLCIENCYMNGVRCFGHTNNFKNVVVSYTRGAGWYFINDTAPEAIQNTLLGCFSLASVAGDAYDFLGVNAGYNTLIGCWAWGNFGGDYVFADLGHNKVIGCHSEDAGGPGMYIASPYNIIVGNTILNPSQTTNNARDGIEVNTGESHATHNIIADNIIYGVEANKHRYSIHEYNANQDYNQYNNNDVANAVTAEMLILGLNSVAYRQHADLFMDVLAISANHVVAAQALAADPTVCAIAAQPDVPRTLSYTITHPTLTAFTLTFVGVNAKGQTVTEVFTQVAGWTGETGNAFATVTSITMSAMTGNTGADTIDVGITDVLGLSNRIYETGDVYKIKKNNANAVVAGAQVNTTYDTYDMAVIGLAVGDDFTIWFRSNLNIVS